MWQGRNLLRGVGPRCVRMLLQTNKIVHLWAGEMDQSVNLLPCKQEGQYLDSQKSQVWWDALAIPGQPVDSWVSQPTSLACLVNFRPTRNLIPGVGVECLGAVLEE